MTTHSLEEIARATGLDLVGDGSLRVARAVEPSEAGADDLAIAMNERYACALKASPAKAAILWQGASLAAFGLEGALLAARPRVALAHVTGLFARNDGIAPGWHPTAVVDPSAHVPPDVALGPMTVIGPEAVIGPGSRLDAHVSVGAGARIGADALIHAGTRIGAGCQIGARFIAQPNAVVGADGFSFEPPSRGSVEAVRETGEVTAANAHGFLRIHSLAAVEIGDDVEIGAATTIDRGTLSPTRIGSGTKIDNQVQIAHNVQVGEMCLICAQVGIAGSARIGDRVVLGGRVGVGDHLTIGSDVVCAAGTLVATNVRDKQVMMGIPGTPREQAVQQVLALRRLPRLLDQMAEIRKKLGL